MRHWGGMRSRAFGAVCGAGAGPKQKDDDAGSSTPSLAPQPHTPPPNSQSGGPQEPASEGSSTTARSGSDTPHISAGTPSPNAGAPAETAARPSPDACSDCLQSHRPARPRPVLETRPSARHRDPDKAP